MALGRELSHLTLPCPIVAHSSLITVHIPAPWEGWTPLCQEIWDAMISCLSLLRMPLSCYVSYHVSRDMAVDGRTVVSACPSWHTGAIAEVHYQGRGRNDRDRDLPRWRCLVTLLPRWSSPTLLGEVECLAEVKLAEVEDLAEVEVAELKEAEVKGLAGIKHLAEEKLLPKWECLENAPHNVNVVS